VHVPTERNETLAPDTEHTAGVNEPKATVRPELAVATTVRLSSNRLSANAPKPIVWSPLATANDCCTCAAGS